MEKYCANNIMNMELLISDARMKNYDMVTAVLEYCEGNAQISKLNIDEKSGANQYRLLHYAAQHGQLVLF